VMSVALRPLLSPSEIREMLRDHPRGARQNFSN
jgi:hypothetical protein